MTIMCLWLFSLCANRPTYWGLGSGALQDFFGKLYFFLKIAKTFGLELEMDSGTHPNRIFDFALLIKMFVQIFFPYLE